MKINTQPKLNVMQINESSTSGSLTVSMLAVNAQRGNGAFQQFAICQMQNSDVCTVQITDNFTAFDGGSKHRGEDPHEGS